MTASDLDIYRSAKLLTDQHGKEAPIHAALKADAMLENGDLDGQAVWLRIVRAVEVLLGTRPGDAAAVHRGLPCHHPNPGSALMRGFFLVRQAWRVRA